MASRIRKYQILNFALFKALKVRKGKMSITALFVLRLLKRFK